MRPHDVTVAEGGIAVIPCEVGNREGRVQWTKDGLTLGKRQDHYILIIALGYMVHVGSKLYCMYQ